MKKHKKSDKQLNKQIIISLICVVFSVVISVITKDYLIGALTLSTSFIGAYLASERKRINYIFQLISYLLTGLIAWNNGVYGLFFASLFIFSPIQIFGFFAWKRNLNKRHDVKVKKLKTKEAVIVLSACILGGLIIGYFLTLIPSQNQAYLDAVTNCISITASIMMLLRYRESWILYMIANVLFIILWSSAILNGGANATTTLLREAGFFLINIKGLISWSKN